MSPVMGYGIINAIAFGTYGNVSAMILRARPHSKGTRLASGRTLFSHELNVNSCNITEVLTLPESSAAGMVAGFTSSFVRTPVERIKTLCQAVRVCLPPLWRFAVAVGRLVRSLFAT